MLNVHYFLVFIDDFSRMKFVYLIKSKTEVYDTFVKFKNWIELKTGKKIKCLRSDNGTEYINKMFDDLAHRSGLEYQYSIAHRQQQNGVSERSMRTLKEMCRAMLIQAKLSSSYWPFGILSATYFRNRSPSSSIDFEIPYERFFGELPKLDHIITFGSPVVIKLDQVANAFSPRGIKGIMLGYEAQHKGYTIFVPELRKLVPSRDVNLLNSSNDDWLDQLNQEIDYCEDDNDVADETNQLDTTVVVYTDGTVNHMIRDVTDVTDLNDAQAVSTESFPDLSSDPVPNQPDDLIERNTELNPSTSNETSPVMGEVIFNRTQKADLSIERLKARWVLKGCVLDGKLLDTYAPVLLSSSFNVLLSLAVNLNLKICQLDIKTAFLNGVLKEKIYTVQPDGFVNQQFPNHVYLLKKALYGLPQSAKVWFEFIRNLLIKYGLRQLNSDECIFVSDDLGLIIGLYVDDFTLLVRSIWIFNQFKEFLSKYVIVTDKDLMKYCLGINIRQMNSKILINQSTLISSLLNDLDMSSCNGAQTPMVENFDLDDGQIAFDNRTLYRSVVGSLLYIALKTRPDVCYPVTRLCAFVASPMVQHFEAAKRIVRYMKSTINFSLRFVKAEPCILSFAYG